MDLNIRGVHITHFSTEKKEACSDGGEWSRPVGGGQRLGRGLSNVTLSKYLQKVGGCGVGAGTSQTNS